MKRIFSRSAIFALAAVVLFTGIAHVRAQEVVPGAENIPQPVPLGVATPATGTPAAETAAAAAPAVNPAATGAPTVPDGKINPNTIPSMLFTYWEHTAIVDAKRSIGSERPVDENELAAGLKTRDTHKVKPPPEEREVRLAGIVYVNADDWTIWLNGKRVTPKAIPKEVYDLKVHKEYVEMKWIDDYTNQIFPLRLRPHQRFNIDTRIFLPG